jgi:LPS-assembly lipoprotein
MPFLRRAWWIAFGMLQLAAIASLCACGFHLRGAAALPFQSISIPSQSLLALELARNIAAASNAKVIAKGEADAIFDLLVEQREKAIISLNTSGQPREYQLRYRVAYAVHDTKGGIYIAPTTLILRRDISFNDQVLAKEYEEQLLYQDMQTDMVQQILRRMQASKLHSPEE